MSTTYVITTRRSSALSLQCLPIAQLVQSHLHLHLYSLSMHPSSVNIWFLPMNANEIQLKAVIVTTKIHIRSMRAIMGPQTTTVVKTLPTIAISEEGPKSPAGGVERIPQPNGELDPQLDQQVRFFFYYISASPEISKRHSIEFITSNTLFEILTLHLFLFFTFSEMETLCNACGINYRRALLKASSLGSSSTQRGNGESSKSSTQDQQDMDMNTMSLEDINLDRLAKEQEQTGYSKLSIQKALKQQIKRKDLLTLRHRTRQMPNLSLGRIPVSALIDSNPNPNPNPNPSSSSSSSVHQNQRNNTLHTQSPYNLNPTTAATATPLTHSMLNSIFNVEVPPPSPPQQRGSLPHGDAMSAEHQNQQDSGRNSNMNNQSPPVSAERGTQQEQQQFEQRLPPFQSFLNHLQHGHKNHSLK